MTGSARAAGAASQARPFSPAGGSRTASTITRRASICIGAPVTIAGIAIILNRLGVQVWYMGDAERGRSLIEESLARHRALRFGVGEAVALGGLGRIEYSEGNVERGLVPLEQSVEPWPRGGIMVEPPFLDLLASYAGFPSHLGASARLGRGPLRHSCAALMLTQGDRTTAAQGLLARTHRRHRGQTQGLAARGAPVGCDREAEDRVGGVWEQQRDELGGPCWRCPGQSVEQGRVAGRRLTSTRRWSTRSRP